MYPLCLKGGGIPACGRQALGMGDFNKYFFFFLLFTIAVKSKQKDLGKMIRHFIFPY